MRSARAQRFGAIACCAAAAWGTGGCQTAPAITTGQPHSVLVQTDGSLTPAVQVAIPVAVTGAQSVSLERDGATVATLDPAQASASAWLPGGFDLWDDSAPYATTLDYQVVATAGGAMSEKSVAVQLSRTLSAFPQITSPAANSSGQGSQPTIAWTPVGVPQANPVSEYRVNLEYVDNPQVPEQSYFVGPDQDTLAWSAPASTSTGQAVIPPPLTTGSAVEVQVVAIASSSYETEETVSRPVIFVP